MTTTPDYIERVNELRMAKLAGLRLQRNALDVMIAKLSSQLGEGTEKARKASRGELRAEEHGSAKVGHGEGQSREHSEAPDGQTFGKGL